MSKRKQQGQIETRANKTAKKKAGKRPKKKAGARTAAQRRTEQAEAAAARREGKTNSVAGPFVSLALFDREFRRRHMPPKVA